MDTRQPLLTEKEAARYLGLSHRTLQMRRHMGQPPAYVKIGTRAVRYKVADLDSFMEAGRVEPQRQAQA